MAKRNKYFNHPNTQEKIVIKNNNRVIKISKSGISSKIKSESEFYFKIQYYPPWLQSCFPLYFGYSISKDGRNYIELEFLERYKNLADILINNKKIVVHSKKIQQKIISLIDAFASIQNNSLSTIDNVFYDLYIARVKERIKLLNQNFQFEKLYSQDVININGQWYPNLKYQIDSLINNQQVIRYLIGEQKISFFHGDFYFENILLSYSPFDLKLVDPKGLFEGLISYDWGKLLCSVIGKYDLIQRYLFSIKKLGYNTYSFKIGENNIYDKFCCQLHNKILNKLTNREYLCAYFSFWIHLISLIPHHLKNRKCQALLFYLLSVQIGDNLIKRLYTQKYL